MNKIRKLCGAVKRWWHEVSWLDDIDAPVSERVADQRLANSWRT